MRLVRRLRTATASALAAAACLFGADVAHAQLADTTDALPGIGSLPTPTTAATQGFAVAGAAGYGYTESVLGQGDAHHRILGDVAASYAPASFFAAGLFLGGHYDFNSGPGAANGGVGTSKIELRFGLPLGEALHLGAAIGVWFPGDKGISFVPKAVTPDFSAVASYDPKDSRFALAARAGFRLDDSAQAVPNASGLPPVGRLSLGYDQADAVLIGLGGEVRVTPSVAILFDAQWDLLVGAGAPPAAQSPLVVEAGTRFAVDEAGIVQALAMLDASPSVRPVVTTTSPLVDIEPRIGGFVGIVLRPGAHKEAPAPPPEPPPAVAAPPAPVVAAPVLATVRGRVTSEEDGSPLAHATVTVRPNTPQAHEATTDDAGRFEIGGLEPGAASIAFGAGGFGSVTRDITLGPTPAELDVPMPKALPSGQVRGLVRDFNGAPIAADIRVEPSGQETKADARGTFEINVPPGTYQIVIRAQGYAEQRRRVVVEKNGVTMLNAELRAGRRGR